MSKPGHKWIVFCATLGTVILASVFYLSRNIAPAAAATSALEAELAQAPVVKDSSESVSSKVLAGLGTKDVEPLSGSLQHWRLVARASSLRLVDSDSLRLNKAVVDLLGLSPSQAAELDLELTNLLEQLKKEERSRAYISLSENGSEEIVVPAFSRDDFRTRFRNTIAHAISSEVGEFVSDQLPFDACLAINNAEMRFAIEKGEDGIDRVSFSREVRSKMAGYLDEPIKVGGVVFASTIKIKSMQLLGVGLDPRYGHLFEAVDKLPKVKAVP